MSIINILREPRLFDYAIFDLVASFGGIYLLAPLLTNLAGKAKLDISKTSWLYLTLPIGIIVHLAVGAYTPMTKQFIDPSDHYLLKTVIVALTILGVKDIKIKKAKK